MEVLTGRDEPRAAAELVAEHPPARVRTKLEVFDWLVRNQDKRVGKNPAGYLVASIRADYAAPGDFAGSRPKTKPAPEATPAADASKRGRKAKEEAERARAREAMLREAWDKLPDAEREAIVAAVKAENPGIGRFKNMLEPLCLAALEKSLGLAAGGAEQKGLFADLD